MKVEGMNGISAEVVQHSISPSGKEIITFNIEYGLIIHAEMLRHRLFSNSVKSMRAIPMNIVRKEVMTSPYVPVWFGAKQSGMVADNEVKNKSLARLIWKSARYPACAFHWLAEKCGAHKEWANRMLSPWQFVRQTVTATEWDNFYELRLHKDAQKDIQEIARCMKEAAENSSPTLIHPNEFHVPYVKRERDDEGVMRYYDSDGSEITIGEAIKASVARVARSSYNKHDKTQTNVKNDLKLFESLITSKPTHGSPAESIATPLEYGEVKNFTGATMAKVFKQDGVTHIDNQGRVWSGNLTHFAQFRQTLKDHTKWGN